MPRPNLRPELGADIEDTMIDTQPVIDATKLSKGDFVEFNAHGLIEVGIYIGTLAFRADTHEVWANGRESMMRIVHITKFIAHEKNKAVNVHKMNCAIGYAGVGLDCICGANNAPN
jgi:hypothetical protein